MPEIRDAPRAARKPTGGLITITQQTQACSQQKKRWTFDRPAKSPKLLREKAASTGKRPRVPAPVSMPVPRLRGDFGKYERHDIRSPVIAISACIRAGRGLKLEVGRLSGLSPQEMVPSRARVNGRNGRISLSLAGRHVAAQMARHEHENRNQWQRDQERASHDSRVLAQNRNRHF